MATHVWDDGEGCLSGIVKNATNVNFWFYTMWWQFEEFEKNKINIV